MPILVAALIDTGKLLNLSLKLASPPANPPVLYNLHASVWWGAVLLIVGLIYFVRFFPKRP